MPPWVARSALGALGAPSTPPTSTPALALPDRGARQRDKRAADLAIARKVAAIVDENVKVGRPFYAGVAEAVPEFELRIRPTLNRWFQRMTEAPRAGKPAWYGRELLPKTWKDGNKSTPEQQERDALAIVNKAYFNAIRGIRAYRGDAQLSSWAAKITKNTAVDYLRRRTRVPAVREAWVKFKDGDESERVHSNTLAKEAADAKKGVESMAAPPTAVEVFAQGGEEGYTPRMSPTARKRAILEVARRAGGNMPNGEAILRDELDKRLVRNVILAHGDIVAAAKKTTGIIGVGAAQMRMAEIATRVTKATGKIP